MVTKAVKRPHPESARATPSSTSSPPATASSVRKTVHKVAQQDDFELHQGAAVIKITDPARRLTDPTLPWARTDGAVAKVEKDGIIKVQNGMEEDYGPMWREDVEERDDVVEADPRIGFLRLLAGCTHEDVEALFDQENVANQRTYADEIKQWNKIERDRIMVSTKDKQAQLAYIEERREEKDSAYARKTFTQALFDEFTGKLGALLNLSGSPSGNMASLPLVRLITEQYELCTYFIDQMNAMKDPAATYAIDLKRLDRFDILFGSMLQVGMSHAYADYYLRRATKAVNDIRHMNVLSPKDLRQFATDIYKYLFVRDTLFPDALTITPLYFNMDMGAYGRKLQIIGTNLHAILRATAQSLFKNYRTAMSMQYIYLSREYLVPSEKKPGADGDVIESRKASVIFNNDRRFKTQYDRLTVQIEAARMDNHNNVTGITRTNEIIADLEKKRAALVATRDRLHAALGSAVTAVSADAEFDKWIQGGSAKGTLLAELMPETLQQYLAKGMQARNIAQAMWDYGVNLKQPSEDITKEWFELTGLLYLSQFIDVINVPNPDHLDPTLLKLFCVVAWHNDDMFKSTEAADGVTSVPLPRLDLGDLGGRLNIFNLLGAFPRSTLEAWEKKTIQFQWQPPAGGVDQKYIYDAMREAVRDPDHIARRKAFEELNTRYEALVWPTLIGNPAIYDALDLSLFFYQTRTIESDSKRKAVTLGGYLSSAKFESPALPSHSVPYSEFLRGAGVAFPHAVLMALVIMTRNEDVEHLVQTGDGTAEVLSDYLDALASDTLTLQQVETNLGHLNQMVGEMTDNGAAVAGNTLADVIAAEPVLTAFVVGPIDAMRILFLASDWLRYTWPTIVASYTKDKAELQKVAESVQSELYRLSTGTSASIADQRSKIKDLYAPSVAWQTRPEATGRLKLSPRVVAALDEGVTLVRRYVPSLHDVALDGLIMSPMESGLPGAFARFVAALMNKAQLTFPHAYNKDIQYALDPKLRAEAMAALHGYSVTRLPDGTYAARYGWAGASSSANKASVSVHYF